MTLSNGKTNLTADAIGIGGDFFLFHPLTLLNGSYFSGNDLMKDYSNSAMSFSLESRE